MKEPMIASIPRPVAQAILTLLCVCLLAFAGSAVAKSLICADCGEVIRGRYYSQTEGDEVKTTCLECAKKSFPTCGICGKTIEGAYSTFKEPERVICPECVASRPKCDLCKVPIGAGADSENRCESCMAKAEAIDKCSDCREPMIKGGMSFTNERTGLQADICADCNAKLPRCTVCSLPSSTLAESAKERVCPDCANNTPRCASCGENAYRIVFRTMRSQRSVCRTCTQKSLGCYACGASTPEASNLLPDGRKICYECRQTAVSDAKTLEAVAETIGVEIRTLLGLEIRHACPVEFIDQNKMKALSDASLKAEQNMGSTPLGLFTRRGDEFKIFVLDNMPREILTGVVAHELAHASMAEWAPKNRITIQCEGFADWVSFAYYRNHGDKVGMDGIETAPGLYGNGFRWAQRLEKNQGYKALLQVLAEADPAQTKTTK